jgi:hypothetical protein
MRAFIGGCSSPDYNHPQARLQSFARSRGSTLKILQLSGLTKERPQAEEWTALAEEQPVIEAALVAQACHDPASFGVLYERHVDRIYAYIYHPVERSCVRSSCATRLRPDGAHLLPGARQARYLRRPEFVIFPQALADCLGCATVVFVRI